MLNKIKKLIAVDLDGTLLNSKRRVSFKTAKYLRYLNKNGYMVVLSSGRPWRSIKSTYRKCGCYGPIISYNGAYIFHPKDKTFPISLTTFPQHIIKEINNKLLNVTSSFMCESEDTVYISKFDHYLKKYFWYKGMKKRIGNISFILKEDPITCIILRPSAKDTLVDTACSNYGNIRLRHWTSSNYAELYVEGVDKGSALNFLINTLKIEKKDTIAFGDAANDETMLKTAGQGFIMKNSKHEFLKKEFPITKFTNNENGVIETLKEIL